MAIVTSLFQKNQRPPDWPSIGTTKASKKLNRFIIAERFIVEFLVSDMKHTLALVEVMRQARCITLEL
jgi:hypothetical protein